ncbi:hypothetical protein GWK47_018044 [Chionoecetes opilio]|uniref:exodeoxyribonuclease III n=1 Tax=Chionoecetes opilio TaxID=41210 RepID=A0A8J4XR79_CHIOP|nr:hypothetical protein GWK47_018044 [Chionoecetes opilio]
MNNRPLKILTRNINGLRNRLIEVQQFSLKNDLNIMCLQETRMIPQIIYRSEGFSSSQWTAYSPAAHRRYRGLALYVRNNIPADCIEHAFVGDNSQAQAINIYDTNGKIFIKIINVYVTDNMLDFSQLYELADGYPSLLMGDLNAYQYKLGDNASGRSNNNGKKLVSCMENNQDVLNILNGPEPTHLQGNKLDYICLINDPALSHHCEVVDTLTSDHFGVYGRSFSLIQ